jgi:hypothetical protein
MEVEGQSCRYMRFNNVASYCVVNSVRFDRESTLEQLLLNPRVIFIIRSEMCSIQLTIFIALEFRKETIY